MRTFLYQLSSITYPSLRDNNTLRRFLVAEVLSFAEELKQRWMEERMEERMAESEDSLPQTEGGAEACQAVLGQRVEARDKPTGQPTTPQLKCSKLQTQQALCKKSLLLGSGVVCLR